MGPLYLIFSILLLVVCTAVVAMILMQDKRSGMSSTFTGMGGNVQQSFWDKNKGRSREGTLERFTKIGGAVFMLVTLLLNVIK